MPDHYFNIPLANHAGLVELQRYLSEQFTMRDLTAPEHFHITLVFLPEVSTEEVLSGVPGINAPSLGLGGDGLTYFNTPEGVAVTVGIPKTPQLIFLQAALYYAMQARGLPLSGHSLPAVYRPHVTLGYADIQPEQWSIPQPLHFEVNRFVLTSPGYVEVASWPLGARVEQVAEMAMTLRDTLVVGEFRGSYPEVRTFADVDVDALTSGDTEPKFVSLPVGKQNVTSQNGNYYSDTFVRELANWIHQKRPTGMQGHLKSEERASAYPTPSLYWIGTQQVGEVLWAKAYLPPGDTRDMVMRTMAAKGKIATSIYGTVAEGGVKYDKENNRRVVDPAKFNLEHIDLAQPDRAGVPELAVVPQVTSEMIQLEDNMEQDKQVNRVQVITEMTADDVQFVPQVVREAIIANAPATSVLQEIATALDVEPGKALATVQELVAYRQKAETERVQGLVAQEVAKHVMPDVTNITPRVKALRDQVAEMVRLRNPKESELPTLVQEIATGDLMKPIIESVLVAEMGSPLGKRAKREASEGHSYLKEKPGEQAKA